MRSRSRRPAPSGARPEASATLLFGTAGDLRADRTRLQWAVGAAVAAHLVLFSVTLPRIEIPPVLVESPREIPRWPDTRLKPPDPVPPVELNRPTPARRVPAPDPTPAAPEPLTRWTLPAPEATVAPRPSPALLEIPEPPPTPPEVLRFGGGMTRPVRISGADPAYTEAARIAGVEGLVILKATIGSDGRVTGIEVVQGLPLGLTDAAVRAVSGWRFRPARLDGRPVAVFYHLTVRFRRR